MAFASTLPLADRLDWGFSNANKTAALIAILMIAIWVLPYMYRPLFWPALITCAGLGICLVETASRGGVLSAVTGLAILAWYAPKPWQKSRCIGLFLAASTVIGATGYLKVSHRLTDGIVVEDKSISNRLELWRVAPRMMVDAPNGWGIGNSGAAFMQWYQSVDRSEAYRTLVNSHLTWMVEIGWIGRFIYCIMWGGVIILCTPNQAMRWLCVAQATWICFGVASFFSSVAECLTIWFIPVLMFASQIVVRVTTGVWPRLCCHKATIAIACGFPGVLGVCGMCSPKNLSIRYTDGNVVLGEGIPTTWVFINSETVGKNYGKTFRKYVAEHQSVNSTAVCFALPENVYKETRLPIKKLIISDQISMQDISLLSSSVQQTSEFVLINPNFGPEMLIHVQPRSGSVRVLFGEYNNRTQRSLWNDSPYLVEIIPEAGNYLPNWPKFIVE